MPRPAGQTREHILETAYELFYRKGFGRVGIDEIAAAAALTKRSLYYHFQSKDELLGAVLDRQHDLALTRIRKYEERYGGDPGEIVDVLFAELGRWSEKPGWTGPGFSRMAMELADLPGHPARRAARRHKAEVERWYVEMFSRAGLTSPVECARQVALLVEGAAALILIHGDRSYADVAGRAARLLVQSAAGAPADPLRPVSPPVARANPQAGAPAIP
jgi:AcrR family transcriptional regulator